ncbi:MAG: class I SAM-dependent methyltransferase [Mycobacteriales bacterium]
MTSTTTQRPASTATGTARNAAIDADRWPELDAPPRAGIKSRAATAIFRHAVNRVRLRAVLPDGTVHGADAPGDAPTMRVVDADSFFRRLGTLGSIGFGESYLAGDWHAERAGRRDSDALAAVLTALAERLTVLVPQPLQKLRRWYDARHPDGERNTISGARSNIHRHYDLSNDLFALFLDKTMTYSSAWFDAAGTEPPAYADLADAQRRKIDGILDLARVGPRSQVLEIGTGWGALAIRAAQRGAQVTSLTISAEQKRLAEEHIADACLSDRISVRLNDYREVVGFFDAVVSVEMVEAVGEAYWPAYFEAIDRMLKPGGRVGIQAITMPHDRMLATRNSYTWIHKYIFPGGIIPSLRAIDQTLAVHTSLRVVEQRSLRADYAETLRLWRHRFLQRYDAVRALGFDDVFVRMWEFYLAYSEAGFRAHYLGVSQLGLARDR